MKIKIYSKALLALALAATVTACDENAWNDNLDGFKDLNDAPIANKQSIKYTLADAEYKTIADMKENKAIAGNEGAEALAAVGTLKRFSAEAPAATYLPAYLSSTNFPYFTLTEGSTIELTYNMVQEEPEDFVAAQNVQTFKVTDDMYADDVWGSENYVNAFTPSMPAADYLPSLLGDYVDHNKAKYCIVSYNQATQEPVFSGGADEPQATTYTMLSEELTEMPADWTIDNIFLGEGLEKVWSWKVYQGAGYLNASGRTNVAKTSEANVASPVLDLSGSAEWSFSFDHAAKFQTTLRTLCGVAVREEGASSWTMLTIPTWPEAGAWTFVNSGDIDLSAYSGKKIQLAFKYASTDEGADTWEIKNLTVAPKAPKKVASRGAAYVPTEVVNVAYVYNGSAWTPAANFVTLSPADYTAMGQKYANLSKAEPYLSTYLNHNYPYASDGAVKYVYWLHYANSATNYECSAYKFAEGTWVADSFVEEVTEQYVLNEEGKWIYDPNAAGSAANPYTASQAFEIASKMSDTATLTDVYVKGVITEVTEISTSYGNATYIIADEPGGEMTLTIFRGKWFNGDKFTKEDQLKVGDEVVVKGNLINYKGDTPEMAQNNQIVSLNGETL